MKKNHKGIIESNTKISKDVFKMVIKSDIESVSPGQFISVLIPNKTLRRPFSIAGFSENKITVMYKLKGEGTNYLSSLNKGDEIDFLAPLGNTFNIDDTKSALLIGAGIGIAPMLFLKDKLQALGIKNFLISGFKDKDEVIEGSDKTVIGGSVLDNIEDVINEFKPDTLFSCGPSIVLKLVSNAAEKFNIQSQVAMEKVMACGIGVCRGCVIKLKNGENKTVCKDGPVFFGEDIRW